MFKDNRKTAVILAGGKGTRLHPYTIALPKPLMPIGEYPILEIIIRQLEYSGFQRIIMAVNHQADIIKAYFGNGERWNLEIEYSIEKKSLSTMGPLKLVKNLPEDFLVMNGDIICDLDYFSFFEKHIKRKSLFSVSSYKREIKSEFGVLDVASDKLVGFCEKPVLYFNVSMGIYAVNRKILSVIPENTAYGFDELMLELIRRDTPADVDEFKGYWLDIGRPDDYIKASEEFELMKEKLLK